MLCFALRSPPPPPNCGNGQLDAGEDCDVGFQWQGAAVPGCDTVTCRFRTGWACGQPGSLLTAQPDEEGPIPIPGPGDAVLLQNGIAQGWGEVPFFVFRAATAAVSTMSLSYN